jgi:hypothetical protein
VPNWALRLSPLSRACANTGLAAAHILGMCYRLEVRWVAARAIAAQVVDG